MVLAERPPAPAAPGAPAGLVSLVGAGPGDPELVTLRGLRRLRAAEAVVHDRLVSPDLLDECPSEAARYDVGKAPGGRGLGQPEINALLVRLGRAGRRVVRLKGGDPFVFGRGGEEALALAAAGVAFEVVPGVSSALAAPAAAGIPVTHRGLAGAVTILAAHRQPGDADLDHDWSALGRLRGTLVFLMVVAHLEQVTDALTRHGRSPDEPAALVRWGTTDEQVLVSATLATIARQARDRDVRPPAVLVVGPTAALAEHLGPALRHHAPRPAAANHLARSRGPVH